MCESSDKILPDETEQKMRDRNTVSRYKMREQAFFLCFESLFSDTDIDELADNAGDARDVFVSDYAIMCARGVVEHESEIDALISAHLKEGWKVSRISRVSLAVLRLAIYEIQYVENVPVSVSINEAVELVKKYSVPEDAAFVNGVLGAVEKSI